MHLWKILLMIIWCLGISVGIYGLLTWNGIPMLLGGVNSLLAVEVWKNIRTACLWCGKEIYP